MVKKDVLISHSIQFYDEGYEYYWHYDYHSRKNGVLQYYKCKHSGSSYKCKSKLSIVDGCVKTSKINHSCKQEMKPSETIIEDATDRMADMVSTIAWLT